MKEGVVGVNRGFTSDHFQFISVMNFRMFPDPESRLPCSYPTSIKLRKASVSTRQRPWRLRFDQNTEAQETALREYIQRRGWTLHKIYRDEGISGTKASRPALDELLRDCRRKALDVVVVWKFDRFARSLTTLASGLELCRALGIDFVSVTEAVDTSLPMGELMFRIIGAISQFERSLIAERVRSGLANARGKGKILGRPPLRRLSGKETTALRRERVQGKLPFRTLASRFGVSVWTAHRLCGNRA